MVVQVSALFKAYFCMGLGPLKPRLFMTYTTSQPLGSWGYCSVKLSEKKHRQYVHVTNHDKCKLFSHI